MFVHTLTLYNYRNYESCSVTFSKGINVLSGNNAQGKTNLLESLVYLSLTRSHRVSNDKKLIKDGCSFASMECDVYENDKKTDIKAVLHKKGKTLFLHHQPVSRSSDFIGNLNVIFFSPDDLSLFSDSPMERRKLINQEAGKLSRKYIYALNRFRDTLKKRNFLLKQPKIDEIYLDTLDEILSEQEYVLIKERTKIVQSLNETIQKYFTYLFHASDMTLNIQYMCCLDGMTCTKENLVQLHKNARKKDMDYRTTTTGIHREDFIFLMNGQNIIEKASQGQKRMILLSLKLALHYYIKQQTGIDAVLLFDDVLSELDIHVQKRLLEICRKAEQCILTTTEIPASIADIPIQEFHIVNGTVSLKGGPTDE